MSRSSSRRHEGAAKDGGQTVSRELEAEEGDPAFGAGRVASCGCARRERVMKLGADGTECVRASVRSRRAVLASGVSVRRIGLIASVPNEDEGCLSRGGGRV